MKKLAFSFIIVLTLVAQSVNAQTTFLDDFEDGNFEGWTVIQGSWQISSPGFESDYCLSSISDTLSIISAPFESWYGIYEVDFRLKEQWQDIIIYIQKNIGIGDFDHTANSYEIGLHPRGGDSIDYIKRVTNNESKILFTYSTSDSNLTETNIWTHAKIERLSTGEINVYVNGKLHMSVIDNYIVSRGVFCIAHWESSSFDNISYFSDYIGENNLLVNPSFELFSNLNGVADYWNFGTGHQASASLSNEAKGGRYSQRIDVISILPPEYIVLSQSQNIIQLQGNRKYRMSFWAKGKGRIAPSIILNDYNYVNWGRIVSLAPSWQLLEHTFITPDIVTSIEELIRYDDLGNFNGSMNPGDWVLIDEATLIGPLIEIDKVKATPRYSDPGNTVVISAFVQDAGKGIDAVKAEIESPDEINQAVIELFDDGNHGDGVANDKIYSNTWATSTTPMSYFVDIVVTEENFQNTLLNNATIFSTTQSSFPQQLTTALSDDSYPSLHQTRDGIVWLLWSSNRSGYSQIWYKNSGDGGITWSNDYQLSIREGCISPTMAQSSDGRIWVFWHESDSKDIWYTTSNDNEISWPSAQQFTTDPSIDEYPNVATNDNGKIVVTWNSWRTGNHDIFCRISLDNGTTWSEPIQITTHRALDEDPAVAIDNKGNIHVVWFWMHDYIQYSMSSDNGKTWSEPLLLTYTSDGVSIHPTISVDSSGKIWIIFNNFRSWENTLASDLSFVTSTDGVVWSAPSSITNFTGYDGFPNVASINDEQWLVWQSNRAVNFDIWAMKIGFSYDINSPPTAYWVKHYPYSPAPTEKDEITIQANIADDDGIASVYLVYSLNKQMQSKLKMYDDGNHNDNLPNDNIWAVGIGKHPAYTIIKYQVEVQDITENTITIPQEPLQAEVLGPFVQSSNILLIADYPEGYGWLQNYYKNALENNDLTFDVWDGFLRGGIDKNTLDSYKNGIVILFIPFGSGYLKDQSIRKNIENYLDSGGKLFVTGQDIGSTIGETDFYKNYLHAKFIKEIRDAYLVNGIANDPITDGLNLVLIEGDGANNQWQVDEIDPMSSAVPIFNYRQSLVNLSKSFFQNYQNKFLEGYFRFTEDQGVHIFNNEYSNSSKTISSTGTAGLRIDTGTYKLVYIAFGFEAISNVEDRNFLMFSVLKWLVPSIHKAGISYIIPNNGYNQGVTEIKIHGFGFIPNTSVKLSKTGRQDINGFKTAVVDSNTIITSFDATGCELGEWDVVINNSIGQEFKLEKGFRIEEGYTNINLEIIGRNRMRRGRESYYIISHGNVGNIESDDFVYEVRIPSFVECVSYNEIKPYTKLTGQDRPILVWVGKLKSKEEQFSKIVLKSLLPDNNEEMKSKYESYYRLNQSSSIEVWGAHYGNSANKFSEIVAKEAEKIGYSISKEEFQNVFQEQVNQPQKQLLETVTIKCLEELGVPSKNIQEVLHPSNYLLLKGTQLGPSEQIAYSSITIYYEINIAPLDRVLDAELYFEFNDNSLDPNEKVGPNGFGKSNSKSIDEIFQYMIFFENVDSATGAAQEIIIMDTLDTNFDLNNLLLDDIQLGHTFIEVPDSAKELNKRIQINDTTDVEVNFTVNRNNGTLRWHFKGTDLVYGGWGDILPPNKKPPEGEGFVSFSIRCKQDIVSNTQIKNRASITFDFNPSILTNEVFNVIDAVPPQSSILSASPVENTLNYEVFWSGVDDSLGSGIKSFDIYYSDNGSPYKKWLVNVFDTSAIFTAEDNHLYYFYSIAQDSTGNVESQPDSFDLTLTLTTIVNEDYIENMPTKYLLSQNYPNPFNPITTIVYQVPKSVNVTLEVYNILGQKVRTLVDEIKKTGYYKAIWDSRDNSGINVSSGIYFIKFKTNEYTSIKKALVLR